jgi:hypothetical protein
MTWKKEIKEWKEESVINGKGYDRKKSLMMHWYCRATYNKTQTFFFKVTCNSIIQYNEP